MIILSILLTIIGIIMIINPSIFWLITESWKSNNSYEPSNLYKTSTRFGGIIFVIVGLINLIVQVFVK